MTLFPIFIRLKMVRFLYKVKRNFHAGLKIRMLFSRGESNSLVVSLVIV